MQKLLDFLKIIIVIFDITVIKLRINLKKKMI